MIPALAYMVATYGTARLLLVLLEDERDPFDVVKILMFLVAGAAIIVMWFLAQEINSMGMDRSILDSLR